jgi:hypothetical protein
MIAKGNLHAHGQKLAAYLITGKMHERAELVELRGFASTNIREAFIDVQIQAEATRCEKPFYHAHVRLPDGEALTREQWLYVADRLERALGFEGQGRAVAFHQDRSSNERHLHVAWSRIDLEQMRAIDPGLYKNKLKQECRGLEKELCLTRVRNERDPEHKTLSAGRSEFEQSRRLGTDLRAIREDIRACWERSDSGRSFTAALAEQGYVLARGDRRDFVVIDQAGGDHALGKRILGVAAGEIRARLTDVDRAQLPSVAQAKMRPAEQARQPVNRDRQQPTPAIEQTHAPAAPERAQAQERPAALRDRPDAPTITTGRPPRGGGRHVSDIAGGFIRSGLSLLGRVAEFLANMISPPAPPTREEQQRAEIGRAEREADATARAAQERNHQLLDQIARNDAERRRQEERDRDTDRGRERDR